MTKQKSLTTTTNDAGVMETERQGPITQQDVADAAGVSRALVSCVLNGRAEEFGISPKTAERIRQTAAEMDYVPNAAARSLKRLGTATIGVLLANFQLDWAHRVQVGMEEVFEDTEFTPIFAPRGWSAKRERKEIEWFLERRVDGLVICVPIPGNEDCYQKVMRLGTPVIFFSDILRTMPHANQVLWDSGQVVREAVRHLCEIGRKRIAFYGHGYQTVMTMARKRAYEDALVEFGLEYDPAIDLLGERVYEDQYGEYRTQLIHDFFFSGPNPPDAVVALNDAEGLGLLRHFIEVEKVRVPEDIAIVGLGDLAALGPNKMQLTTLREPLGRMGRIAAQSILRLINEPSTPPVNEVVQHVELLRRDTT